MTNNENIKEINEMTIEEMNLSVRSYNSLHRAGFRTFAELYNKSDEDLLKIRNLGMKGIKEVRCRIDELSATVIDICAENTVNADASDVADVPEVRLDTPIEEMNFSHRTYSCLQRAGIKTVGDIAILTDSELLKVRNLGMKGVREIRLSLEEHGISSIPENKNN